MSAFQYRELLNQPLLRPSCDGENTGIFVVSLCLLISSCKCSKTVGMACLQAPYRTKGAEEKKMNGAKKTR